MLNDLPAGDDSPSSTAAEGGSSPYKSPSQLERETRGQISPDSSVADDQLAVNNNEAVTKSLLESVAVVVSVPCGTMPMAVVSPAEQSSEAVSSSTDCSSASGSNPPLRQPSPSSFSPGAFNSEASPGSVIAPLLVKPVGPSLVGASSR